MKMNDLLVAIPHSTSHICSTFVANLIATTFEMCRTSNQRIRTSANVEGHLLLYYFNLFQLLTWVRIQTLVENHQSSFQPPSLRRLRCTSRFAMHIPRDARERVGRGVSVSLGGWESGGEGRISDFARLSRNPIPPAAAAQRPERAELSAPFYASSLARIAAFCCLSQSVI